jgi:hypothetical protein
MGSIVTNVALGMRLRPSWRAPERWRFLQSIWPEPSLTRTAKQPLREGD